MRIVRYHSLTEPEQIRYGQYKNGFIYPISGDIFGQHLTGLAGLPIGKARLLAPVTPGKLYAIGLNYQEHINELHPDQAAPQAPVSFLAAPEAIIGPEAAIRLDHPGCRIDQEAELCVVIGRSCRNVSPEEALDYVFGYTCGNDVSNRVWQAQDGQWFRAKSQPTYKPLGPWIETELDPSSLRIQGRVNGKTVQDGSTSQLIFDVPALVAFLSSFVTLEPGDVIMTGTPKGVTQLHPGDVVEVEIEGIGTLKNTVL